MEAGDPAPASSRAGAGRTAAAAPWRARRPRPRAEPEAPDAILSPTLGELYFNQGFTDKAVEVYRALSGREPGNERLAARLKELEALQRTLGGPPPAVGRSAARRRRPPAPSPPGPPRRCGRPPGPPPDAAGERRQAIERTIGRLEGLLAAIRKG